MYLCSLQLSDKRRPPSGRAPLVWELTGGRLESKGRDFDEAVSDRDPVAP